MVTIEIGSAQRNWQDSGLESWINQMINPAHAAGLPVCVRVRIDEETIRMALQTPGCSSGGGGGRPPNSQESRIFELWNKLGLNRDGFTGGNLIAFLKQLRTFI